MAQGVIFHTRSRGSFLNKCHPGVKMAAMCASCVLLASLGPAEALALSGLVLLAAVSQRLPARALLSQGAVFVILAVFIAATEWWSTGSPFLAAAASSRFLASVLSSVILLDSTSPDDMARAVSQVFGPVFGKWARLAGSVIELTISMVPLIFDTVSTMREARKARLSSFMRHPLRNTAELASALLQALLDKAGAWADALAARSYDPCAKRSCPLPGWRDLALVAVCGLSVWGVLWTSAL